MVMGTTFYCLCKTMSRLKKLITMVFLVLGQTQYTTAVNGLWLEKHDGSRIGYVFDQDITISYNSTSLVMSIGTAMVEYPFDDVKRVYFDDNVTKIVEIPFAERQQLIHIVANGLDLRGFDAGTFVTISDLTGRVVIKNVIDEKGLLQISWSNLPCGVYVVKAKKTSIKFYNK